MEQVTMEAQTSPGGEDQGNQEAIPETVEEIVEPTNEEIQEVKEELVENYELVESQEVETESQSGKLSVIPEDSFSSQEIQRSRHSSNQSIKSHNADMYTVADGEAQSQTNELDGVLHCHDGLSISAPVSDAGSTPSGSGLPSRCSTPTSQLSSQPQTPSSNKKFPMRQGIHWHVGAKLEAMDFLKKWYPAKIVEIDETDNTALIHFDGWNQRYDEWVDMTSDTLRPATRHSERKDRGKSLSYGHKAGSRVYAKWTDCRMYPARIVAVNANGTYDVQFYDGVEKTVQPINVKPIPPEVQQQLIGSGVFEDIDRKFKLKREREGKRSRGESESSPPEKKDSGNSSNTDVCYTEETPRRNSTENARSRSASSSEERKPVVGQPDIFQDTPPKFSEPSEGNKRKRKRLMIGKSIFAKKARRDSATKKPVVPNTSMEIEPDLKENPEEDPNGSDKETKPEMLTITAEVHADSVKKRRISSDTMSVKDSPADPGVPPTFLPGLKGPPLIPKKAFKVEEDHNPYKCPFEACGKGFRKLSLLEYHLKYYHTDGADHKPPSTLLHPPSQPKKRRKTISVCSTDSEISVGGRSTSSKPAGRRKRESTTSLSTLPDTPTIAELPISPRPMIKQEIEDEIDDAATSTTEDTMSEQKDILADDTTETAEEDGNDIMTKDEVVNCICQLNEENGLMIQCEVCLCWQHAVCMELTEMTLPKKYICFVCNSPPGVRDSASYMWNQDWVNEGVLTTFSFLPQDESLIRRAPIIKATHDLMGDMHGVGQVLGGVRQKLHILQKKQGEEFNLWTKNWDTNLKNQKNNQSFLPGQIQIKQEPGVTSVPDASSGSKSASVAVPQSSGVQHIAQNLCQSSDTKNTTSTNTIQSETATSVNSSVPKDLNSVKQSTEQSQQPGVSSQDGASMAAPPVGHNHDYSMVPGTSTVPKQGVGQSQRHESMEVEGEVGGFDQCEKNLVDHVTRVQDDTESRLDRIDQQVTALESADRLGSLRTTDILSDMPRLRKILHRVMLDLSKVKRMALYH